MYIHVRVTTDAKRESVKKLSDTHFAVSVKEPAEQNRANHRVVELVAAELSVTPAQVRIVSGHHAPSKLLLVR